MAKNEQLPQKCIAEIRVFICEDEAGFTADASWEVDPKTCLAGALLKAIEALAKGAIADGTCIGCSQIDRIKTTAHTVVAVIEKAEINEKGH